MNNYQNIKVAIIGAGRWGKNHIKTAASILNPEQITVCDSNPAAKVLINSISPAITYCDDYKKIADDKDINAVIIATPAETHYQIAKLMLESGKHTLVEKPITLHLHEAEELNAISAERSTLLMVGHVLLYHPAVLKMKEGIDEGKIGKLQYIYSNRLNLGAIRSEENILWSFAPHDVSVIQFLVEQGKSKKEKVKSVDDHSSIQPYNHSVVPDSVSASGASYVQPGIEDTTITYLKYPNGVNAHIFVSWLHPFKEQRMVVIGDKGMYVFEDSAKDNKLKYYHKGFSKNNGVIEKFDDEFEPVEFENKMPLTEEQKHFFDCITSNKSPRTSGEHAYDVLKILVEATEELRKNKG